MAERLDPGQRRAVETERTAVVTAGAGSGKTTVLAERFLWLLRRKGAQVQDILTLTFTEKAAAEMYERIYRRLEEEGEEGRSHLQAFDQAQISTLDSFCAQLARDGAGLFGLPPTLRHDPEGVERLAAEQALDFLLGHWREPALAALLAEYDFDTLWRELFTRLAVEHFHFAVREDLPSAAERQLAECRQALDRQWGEAAAVLESLQGGEGRTPTMRQNQEAARRLSAAAPLLEEERWEELASAVQACGGELNLKGGGASLDWLAMKEQAGELKKNLLPRLLELASTLARRGTLRAVFGLLERFRLEFLERKRALGLVTFRDAAEMAVQALRLDLDLRRHYKRRFRYILIDEFQDNNRLQKELLYLLAEREELCLDRIPEAGDLAPDKLFFVGDEKQSIYRFRGADVSVFASLAGELGRAGGCSLRLDRNYRSSPGLVAFFNELFGRVMGGASRPFEARYQDMQAGQAPQAAAPGVAAPASGASVPAQIHLLLQPADGKEDEEAAPQRELLSRKEAEAFEVARFLRESVDTGRFQVPAEDPPGTVRPARLEDFTILLRSTGNQVYFERMLRRFDLPYSTPNIRSLFLEAPLNDFYHLLRLAVEPEDRLAYAGLLRSPWVNVSDAAFLTILLEPPGEAPFEGLDRLELDPADRLKLERARESYLFARERADRVGHGELIHALWHRFGYRHGLLGDPRAHNYLEFFDFLVELAARAEARGDGLAAFLDELAQDLGQYRRTDDLEAPPARARGVQLLTIHKSKGLQFPIVVLVDAGNRGRGSTEKRPYYLSDEFGITLNLGGGSYFARIGEEETAAKELAEARRLLYVALTRARSHLVLSGTVQGGGGRAEHAHLDMVLRALEMDPANLVLPSALDERGLRLHLIRELPRERSLAVPAPVRRPALERLEAAYAGEPLRRPALRREFTVSQVSDWAEAGRTAGALIELPALPIDPLLAELDREATFGTLTHDLLAAWLRAPGGPPPEPDWNGLGLPPEHREACLRDALQLCRGFLDSPLGRQAAADPDRRTELPFVFRWDGRPGPLYLSGQIDLVFTSGGRVHLVDFKTDRQYREGQYEVQLGLYALACAELPPWVPPAAPPRPVIFLLRSGQAVPVERVPELDALLARLPRRLEELLR